MEQQKLFKIQRVLVFLYLAFFPFGQLPKLLFQLLGFPVFVSPLDLIALLLGFSFVFYANQGQIYSKNRPLFFLISTLIFSWVAGSLAFGFNPFFPSLLYLIRLISYLLIFLVVQQLVINRIIKPALLAKGLILVGICVAFFGVLQFSILPDLRNLHLLGWDDHYYRLTSTFLDPAYAGIILVLTILMLLFTTLFNESTLKKPLIIVLMILLALTYSRASYLSLSIVVIFLFGRIKFAKWLVLLGAAVLFLLLVIPNAGGEGVNLLRTNSIFLRIGNYYQSIKIFEFSPVFGVGYNNICEAKKLLFSVATGGENACSGLDNSFLFLLATTGIAGFFALINFLQSLWGKSNLFFKMSLLAIGTHALFSNTLVYPFVLFWIAALFALRENKNI